MKEANRPERSQYMRKKDLFSARKEKEMLTNKCQKGTLISDLPIRNLIRVGLPHKNLRNTWQLNQPFYLVIIIVSVILWSVRVEIILLPLSSLCSNYRSPWEPFSDVNFLEWSVYLFPTLTPSVSSGNPLTSYGPNPGRRKIARISRCQWFLKKSDLWKLGARSGKEN